MDQKRTLELLNALVVVNNERIQVYEVACDEVDEYELQISFEESIKTSFHCIAHLTHEISKLDIVRPSGTKIASKFFRLWMEIKFAVTGKNLASVLDSCAEGEHKTLRAYTKYLKRYLPYITPELNALIARQMVLINTDREKIFQLRATFKNSFSLLK